MHFIDISLYLHTVWIKISAICNSTPLVWDWQNTMPTGTGRNWKAHRGRSFGNREMVMLVSEGNGLWLHLTPFNSWILNSVNKLFAWCCKDNNFLFEKPLLPYFSLCLCFIILNLLFFYKAVVIVLQGFCRFPTPLL